MIKNCDFRCVFIFTWGVIGVKIRTERGMQSVVSGRKGEKQEIGVEPIKITVYCAVACRIRLYLLLKLFNFWRRTCDRYILIEFFDVVIVITRAMR